MIFKKENSILCAAALTYFFLEIIIKKTKSSFNLSNYLIYVLLALVCDVMPLRKINRSIALNLIENFNIKDNIVFKTLSEINLLIFLKGITTQIVANNA